MQQACVEPHLLFQGSTWTLQGAGKLSSQPLTVTRQNTEQHSAELPCLDTL